MDNTFWNTNFTYKLTITGDGTGAITPAVVRSWWEMQRLIVLLWIKEMISVFLVSESGLQDFRIGRIEE